MRNSLFPVWVSVATLTLAGLVSQAMGQAKPDENARAPSERSSRDFRESVTVFPVVVTPGKNFTVDLSKRGAEVVGMLLERAGVENVELADAMFSPSEGADIAQIAASFGKFVREDPIGTDYAIFGQIVGTPKTGPQEIRTIVVDKRGKVILADRADQQAFSKSKIEPDCPLTCMIFLVGRIQKLWGLEDPLREDAPTGKLNTAWREKTGLPSESELNEMKRRLNTLKKSLPSARLSVYPVRPASDADQQGAARLAGMLADCGLRETLVSKVDPRLEIQGDPNEQKVLWDAARAFRQFVRKNPPAAEYALFADYGIFSPSPGQSKVSHVHFIVCTRSGEWVIVDFQNSHHDDFQQIKPKSKEDCNRLVAERLKGYLSAE